MLEAAKYKSAMALESTRTPGSGLSERYNHRTKRCCVLSQDDGTSSSARCAIECPKPTSSARSGDIDPGHPKHKAWRMPATAQQAPRRQAGESLAADGPPEYARPTEYRQEAE